MTLNPPTPQQQATEETTPPEQLRYLARESTELTRLVAKNPNAEPELLQELASSPDPATREGVATNPNTSPDVLMKLGEQFPGQLLDNPVFSLLLLENPNLLAEIPLPTLQSLLKQEKVPKSFLEWAAGHSIHSVLPIVAENPNTPESTLELLAEGSRALWLGSYLVRNPNIPGSSLEKLAEHENEEVRWYVAQHPNTLRNTLERLARDQNVKIARVIRIAVAMNPNTPESALELLAEDETYTANIGRDIRKAVAENPNTPLSALKKLAQDKHPWVRTPVAVHPKITEGLLIQMKIAPDEQAARDLWYAKQSTTEREILEQLAEHAWDAVRLAVAKNPNTPGNVMDKLLKRGGGELLMWEWIAQHPNTPASVLEKISRHSFTYLRHLAAKNPNAPKERAQE